MTTGTSGELLTLSIDMEESPGGPNAAAGAAALNVPGSPGETGPATGDTGGVDADKAFIGPGQSDVTLRQQSQRRTQLAHQAGMLNKAGRNDDLEKVLEKLLEIDPNDAQAYYNLAVLAHRRDEKSRAERFLRRAIEADPDYIEAYQTLGDIFYQARHLLSAIEIYERGLARVPTRLPLLQAMLRSCYMQRSVHRVAAVSRRILDIDDRNPEALNSLAWATLKSNGDLAEVAGYIDRVLAVAPDSAATLALSERLAAKRGDAEAARDQAEKLNRLAAESWTSTSLAADTFISLDMADRAAVVVRAYLEHHPDDPSAHRYLATTLMQDGDFVGGHQVLEQVLALVPDKPNLQMVFCLNAFRLGDIETFFRYHHTRWQRDGSEAMWELPVPVWDGKPITHGKLVVQCEQGVGDYVMFAVCFPGVRALARDVIIKIVPRMVRLFQRSFPDMVVIPDKQLPYGSPIEAIAARTTAGDLPSLIGGDIEHLPGKGGVLIADPVAKLKLRRKYEEMFPGKRLIGISWRSGNRDSAAMRSLELPHWKPIFDVADCAFISLQYGDISRDMEELRAQLGDRVYWDRDVNPLGDMDPFTAQLSAMDLIISVDNSTIHFAGGLGKPCWAMLPLNSDWRWQVERGDTVWYDSLELVRGDKEGGWEQLVDTVARRLADIDDAPLKAAEVAYLQRALATLMDSNRAAEAEQYGRLLLAAGEHRAEAMRAIARSALGAGKYADAAAILHRAMELDPADPAILSDLATALAKSGDAEAGLDLARDTTRRFPKNDDACIACGRILTDLGRYDEATDFFARVLRRDPANVQSRLSLAGLQAAQGEWEIARRNFERTLEEDPGNAAAHTALAEMDLRRRRWDAGWENFRWRYAARPGIMPPHLADIEPEKQPKRWAGGSLRKPRLLLSMERNIVEQILLSAILPDVIKESRRVTLESDPRLVPALARSFPGVSVIPSGRLDAAGLEAQRIQMISTLGDLAGRFRAEDAQFPQQAKAYLAADPVRQKDLRARYQESFPGRKLVGLAWRGKAKASEASSIGLWLPLIDRPDVAVVALALGDVQAELAHFAEATGRDLIHDRRLDFSADLEDYIAQIAACDCVISVEDLTAVIAAALGKPTVKLRKPVDHWWWGLEDAATPWFPNVAMVAMSEASRGEADEAAVADAIEQLNRIAAGR